MAGVEPGRRELMAAAAGMLAMPALGKIAAATSADAPYRTLTTARQRTGYFDAGPADGPLIIFLHGWPDLGLVWRSQFEHFAAAGWRCIAPDLRGYGGSSVPTRAADYALREVVADMCELHDSLGGKPAVWIGHSLGCTVAWAMATHHPERCRGTINLTVPHFARGNAVTNLVPLVNRAIYPAERFPAGQWDYMLFYVEHFTKAVRGFEAHLEQTVDMFYGRGSAAAVGEPTPLASIRRQGGWFPPGSKPPPRETLLPPDDRRRWLADYARTGFGGASAWYLNDEANIAYAAEAPNFGRIGLPVLFLHALWDTVCDTATSRLADPMREDCADLTEARIAAGHLLMLERPEEVNRTIGGWLDGHRLGAG